MIERTTGKTPPEQKSTGQKRVEPYGYDETGYPQGHRYCRPDGYDPYRENKGPSRPHGTRPQDGRRHPETEYSHYGDDARDPDAPAQPPLPHHLKTEMGKDKESR